MFPLDNIDKKNISDHYVFALHFQYFYLSTNSFNTLETPLLEVDKVDTQVPLLDLDSRTHTHSFSNCAYSTGMELHRVEGESKLSSPKNNDASEGTLEFI